MSSNLGNKEIMAKNIQYYMNLNKKSRNDICEALGIKYTTFTDWVNGNSYPRIDKIELMANYFGIKKSDLVEDPNLHLKNLEEDNQSKLVPLLGHIAAGAPILAEENVERYFTLDISVKADFALRIRGDSMIGENIFDGDIAFLNQQPDVENGEIAAVVIEDSATLKKIYHTKDSLILQAANDKYAPIVIKRENINNTRIIGKLIAVLNKR